MKDFQIITYLSGVGGGGTGQIKAEIFCYKSVPCLSAASEVIPSDPLGISSLRLCIRLPKAQGIYFIISQIPHGQVKQGWRK